jgi:LPXTG-site transpeptidase (sortase) family protein
MSGTTEPPEALSLPRRRWLRALELTLWLLGAVAVGGAGWSWLDGARYQRAQERLLEESLAAADRRLAPPPEAAVVGRKAASVATGKRGSPRPPGDRPLLEARERRSLIEPVATGVQRALRRGAAPWMSPPAARLTRLTVPRLGMTVMVAEGVDAATLRRAAGRIPGTAPLGSAGNVGLAGHRDSFFRPLRRIELGDEIVLTSPHGSETYRVEWTDVVSPQAVEVLQPTAYPALTLVTCYPFRFVGPAPDRFVVRARRVESRAVNVGASEALGVWVLR